jgi:hypothetical protein
MGKVAKDFEAFDLPRGRMPKILQPNVTQEQEERERKAIMGNVKWPEKVTGDRKKDAEWLTPRQRAWVELVSDYRGTLAECARVAGYSRPNDVVNYLLRNPYVVRGVLRRYHKRMMKLHAAFKPLPSVVMDVERPRKQLFIPVGGLAAKVVREMQTGQVRAAGGGHGAGSADSILGEKS